MSSKSSTSGARGEIHLAAAIRLQSTRSIPWCASGRCGGGSSGGRSARRADAGKGDDREDHHGTTPGLAPRRAASRAALKSTPSTWQSAALRTACLGQRLEHARRRASTGAPCWGFSPSRASGEGDKHVGPARHARLEPRGQSCDRVLRGQRPAVEELAARGVLGQDELRRSANEGARPSSRRVDQALHHARRCRAVLVDRAILASTSEPSRRWDHLAPAIGSPRCPSRPGAILPEGLPAMRARHPGGGQESSSQGAARGDAYISPERLLEMPTSRLVDRCGTDRHVRSGDEFHVRRHRVRGGA